MILIVISSKKAELCIFFLLIFTINYFLQEISNLCSIDQQRKTCVSGLQKESAIFIFYFQMMCTYCMLHVKNFDQFSGWTIFHKFTSFWNFIFRNMEVLHFTQKNLAYPQFEAVLRPNVIQLRCQQTFRIPEPAYSPSRNSLRFLRRIKLCITDSCMQIKIKIL